MPRSPEGVYSKPPGTNGGPPNAPISSTAYNSLMNDIAQDLNTPRPVVAGGMGANTAIGGIDNLHTASVPIPSSTTTDLSGATGISVLITGNTDIENFGTVLAGAMRVLTFEDDLTIVYDEDDVKIILPTAGDYEVLAGDVLVFVSEGAGVWRLVSASSAAGSGAASLPKVTVYDTAGSYTHTFQSGTTKFQIEGCGGGGAGAGSISAIGSAGQNHYGAGGHSGWFYETDILDRGSFSSAALVVGAAGTSTAASETKVNGGNTSYSDGTNSFTWDGGLTPINLPVGDIGPQIFQYNQPSTPSVVKARFGTAGFGTRGITFSGTGVVSGGKGGCSPYGQGGSPVTPNSAGNAGAGNGSGGSGSAKNSGTTSTYNGGAGRPGIIIIKEWS